MTQAKGIIAAAQPSGPPLTAVLVLRIRPGREEEFLALLHPVLDAMRHEATFINAVLHRDPEDPSRFMLYETWADRTDLVEVQMHRPYRAAYWAALPDLLAAPREVQVWQPMRSDAAPPASGRG
jgi:quinol monooxygenase YgiN